jgi:hypothetical protein
MKKIKYILLTFAFIFGSLSSCDNTLDINTDPLVASSANPNVILPFVFGQYSARKVSELGTRICDVSQYISDTFNSPATGAVSATLSGNFWGMMYQQMLGNLSLVKKDAEAAGESSNNVNAIATIMTAYGFYELTSLWEKIPFSEALDGVNFPTPKFDDQEDVLNGIVALLDESLTLINNRPSTGEFAIAESSDFLYGGDMDKWEIFANSLKLRVLMMLKSGGANVDSQIVTTLSAPLMTSNDEAAYIKYTGGPGAANAMHTIITAFFGPDNESQDVFGPGDPIDALLNGSGDPRFDLWIARNNLPAPGNQIFPDPTTSVLSNNVIRPSLPDVIMTPDEIDFYKAQLALQGISQAGNAEANYKNGVTNALKWWGQDIDGAIELITSADITTYVNSLSAPTINDVYNEQYLGAFLNPVLAWNHVRRNKVPVLEVPPGAVISTILKRFTYAPDEIDTNPNTPANEMTDKPMWFENL